MMACSRLIHNPTGKAEVVPNPKERDVLLPDQVGRILGRVMPDWYRMIVLLAAWCGLRWGQVSELRRCDVSADGLVVAVTGVVTHCHGRCVITGTKRVATAHPRPR
jgi:integrase